MLRRRPGVGRTGPRAVRPALLSARHRWRPVALVPFASQGQEALAWSRTAAEPPAFALRSGDQEVATLLWARPGGSLASARTADAAWSLKRAGFLQPTILVRAADGPAPIARLSAHFTHHEIQIGGSPAYRLRRAGRLVPAWRVTTDRGVELLHIEPVAEGRTLQGGAVVVAPGAPPDTLLLAVLSWYFIVLSWFEDEAIETLAPFEGPDPPLARGSR